MNTQQSVAILDQTVLAGSTQLSQLKALRACRVLCPMGEGSGKGHDKGKGQFLDWRMVRELGDLSNARIMMLDEPDRYVIEIQIMKTWSESEPQHGNNKADGDYGPGGKIGGLDNVMSSGPGGAATSAPGAVAEAEHRAAAAAAAASSSGAGGAGAAAAKHPLDAAAAESAAAAATAAVKDAAAEQRMQRQLEQRQREERLSDPFIGEGPVAYRERRKRSRSAMAVPTQTPQLTGD